MKRAFFNILVLFLPFIAAGQEIKVSAGFDSSRIYIGDQVHFNIVITQPPDLQVILPSFKDSLQKNIEIIQGPAIDTIKENGNLKITEKYLITSFDSGTYKIKPVFVEVKSPDGLKRFFSDISQLDVMKITTAPADSTAKIYDIIAPYRAPLTAGEIIPWVLIVLIASAAVWLLFRFLKNRKKQVSVIEETKITEPAHVIAFRELEKLNSEALWQNGEFKLYYTRLTEILRQYLENRYMVYSLELTTSETLNALVKTGFKKDASYDRLKSVLVGADLVKFAKYVPEKEENELHYRNAWEFVNETKPVVIPVDADEINKGKEGSI
jgi:hypothetical protein